MESFFAEYERQQAQKEAEAEERTRKMLRRVQLQIAADQFRPVPTTAISWPVWLLPFCAGFFMAALIFFANTAFAKVRADLHTFQQLKIEDAQ